MNFINGYIMIFQQNCITKLSFFVLTVLICNIASAQTTFKRSDAEFAAAKLALSVYDTLSALIHINRAIELETKNTNPDAIRLCYFYSFPSDFHTQLQDSIRIRYALGAKKACEEAYGRSNSYIGSLQILGEIYNKQKNSESAIAIFKELLSLTQPDTPSYNYYLYELGRAYLYGKNYKESTYLLEKSCQTLKQSPESDSLDVVHILEALSIAYYKDKQYEKAYSVTIEILDYWCSRNKWECLKFIEQLAQTYHAMGNVNMAQTTYENLLSLNMQIVPKDDTTYNNRLKALGILHKEKGEFDIAISKFKEAVDNVKVSKDKYLLSYVSYLNQLAATYFEINEYDSVYDVLNEALISLEEYDGVKNEMYITLLCNVIYYYNIKNSYDKSLEILFQIESILEKSNIYSIETQIDVIKTKVRVYSAIGNYEEAIKLGAIAKQLIEDTYGIDHEEYNNILNSLALAFEDAGQYDQALMLFDELFENNKGNSLSIHMENYAGLLAKLGQYEKAIALSTKEIETIYSKFGTQNLNYARLLHHLGSLYIKVDHFDDAERLLEESKLIVGNLLDNQHINYSTILYTISSLYLSTNRCYEAKLLVEEAKRISETVYGVNHSSYGLGLNYLARVYSCLNENDLALKFHEETLVHTRRISGEQHPEYGTALMNLAGSYKKNSNYDMARKYYLEALENYKGQIFRAFNFLSESEKERFVIEKGIYPIVKSFVTSKFPFDKEALIAYYEMELLNKEIILSASQRMRRVIERERDEHTMEVYKEWFYLKNEIAKQYTKPIKKRVPDLRKWEGEVENLERKLIQLSKAFKETEEIAKTTWKDIQNKLEDNEVVIEFSSFKYCNDKEWTDSTLYTALVVKKGYERPVLVPLFEQRQLDSLLVSGNDAAKVAGLYRGSEGKSTAKNHKKLYDLVWKPLEEKETVHFAPSGSLHQIAFSAILTPDGQYLSDKYRLNQVSTTAKILQEHKKGELKDITLYGGIDYEADGKDLLAQAQQLKNDAAISRSLTTDLERGASGWDYLRGTRDEVEAIKGTSEKAGVSVNYYTGKTALEERFKQQSGKKSPAILHVATHGFFFPDPEKQYKEHQLLLQEEKNVYKLSDNPLNRSGLLFSGANTAWKGEPVTEGLEDGILTAYEASHVSLPNTQLVVLSACETGLGDIKGSEGVFGLQRAFKLAGAEYLLMSLWKVPDQETAEFMIKFYELLFSTKDIPGSYDKTQRYMKEKYSKEPYKWAAFVLVR